VDDNVFNLLILENFISSNKFYKFQIIKATNGLEAVNIFKERNFEKGESIEIIIMDCQMPILSG